MSFLVNCVNVLGSDLYELIQDAFTAIRICVPILVIVLISIDMLSCVTAGDEEKMKAAQGRSIKRLIIGVVIFFIPTFVNLIIKYSNTDLQACWGEEYDEISEKLSALEDECDLKQNNNTDESIVYKWNNMDETCDVVNVKTNVTSLKYFTQQDYGSVKFCSSSYSLAGSGCGAVSLAMIAYSYSGEQYTPPNVAKIICNNSDTNGGVAEQDLKELAYLFDLKSEYLFFDNKYFYRKAYYGCPSYPTDYAAKVLKAVQDGKSVILGIPRHYVAVGPNEKCSSDQVYLYDPWSTKYNGCYSMKDLWTTTSRMNSSISAYCGWNAAIAYEHE